MLRLPGLLLQPRVRSGRGNLLLRLRWPLLLGLLRRGGMLLALLRLMLLRLLLLLGRQRGALLRFLPGLLLGLALLLLLGLLLGLALLLLLLGLLLGLALLLLVLGLLLGLALLLLVLGLLLRLALLLLLLASAVVRGAVRPGVGRREKDNAKAHLFVQLHDSLDPRFCGPANRWASVPHGLGAAVALLLGMPLHIDTAAG
jgi:hypothetical protein